MNSCSSDKESELGGNSFCEFTAVSYSQDVLPIIDDNCYGCHGNGSTQGGIDLDGYNLIEPLASNGVLFCSINHDSGCSSMPQNQPQLPDCDILLIETWINEGAQNN